MKNRYFIQNIGILFLLLLFIQNIIAQRIYVEGNKLKVNGNPIYMNGCDTPWNNWDNDFGGAYNSVFWESEFTKLQNDGINSVRIWISCGGDLQPYINTDGTVTGVSAAFWNNVDDMVSRAKNHGLYIMPTMMSFDHVKNANQKYQSWRNMFNDSSKVRTFINNYLVPFVVRYKDNRRGTYYNDMQLCVQQPFIILAVLF